MIGFVWKRGGEPDSAKETRVIVLALKVPLLPVQGTPFSSSAITAAAEEAVICTLSLSASLENVVLWLLLTFWTCWTLPLQSHDNRPPNVQTLPVPTVPAPANIHINEVQEHRGVLDVLHY